ncbi:hypothetical protein [Gordonia sp. CPCC 205333]|uniref:hypothetical protein n=1 Tax=Gordonia sp. CPCC 205333 TaxID=3140790 RepID=UPI003AF384D6
MKILRDIATAVMLPFLLLNAAYEWVMGKLFGPLIERVFRLLTPVLMPPLNALGRFLTWFTTPTVRDDDDDS